LVEFLSGRYGPEVHFGPDDSELILFWISNVSDESLIFDQERIQQKYYFGLENPKYAFFWTKNIEPGLGGDPTEATFWTQENTSDGHFCIK
jgi:hypothetical protein